MPRKDLLPIFIVGAGVGLLVQPVLSNFASTAHASLAMRAGIFVFFTLFAPFALWLASIVAKAWKGIYQFAQFAAVGTLNSFIDLGVFDLERNVFYGAPTISNGLFATFKAVSFLCATTNSFIWNKYWTFNSKEKATAGQTASFYGVALVGWGLNVGVATLVKASGPASNFWVGVVAPLGGIAASFLWDFFGYKYLVFKKKDQVAVAA